LKGDNIASELPKTKGSIMIIQMVLIRDEQDTDYALISDVTESAFETVEISNHTEQFIIEALRSAQALTISLVAEVNGWVVGLRIRYLHFATFSNSLG
jgi:predicted N-acetyltransferase YhbS